MNNSRQLQSWAWHPGVAVLAAVVAVAAFIVGLSRTLGDPSATVAIVVIAGVALVTGFYLTVFAPMPAEKQSNYDWWAVGGWLVGNLLTTFVLLAARRPGGVLWPALILIVPWYVAVFRAIPPERASRPMRATLAAFVVAVGAASAPFAWSGNSPTPLLDWSAYGYLWGLAVAAVALRAGESWLRVAAILTFAVCFMSVFSSQFTTLVAMAYVFSWMRRRRFGSALQEAAA
jgi:hypothetical protein